MFESIAIRIVVSTGSFEEAMVFCPCTQGWVLLERFGVIQKIACGLLKTGPCERVALNQPICSSSLAVAVWMCHKTLECPI